MKIQESFEGKWSSDDSEVFSEYRDVFVPCPDLICSLISQVLSNSHEDLRIVDLGSGDGVLIAKLLSDLPKSNALLVDGSKQMLDHAQRRLQIFEQRVQIVHANLQSFAELEASMRRFSPNAIITSLAVHHLKDSEKSLLFRLVYESLDFGDPFVYFDLVEPMGEIARKQYAFQWDSVVKDQSNKRFGDSRAQKVFEDEEWNYFADGDPDGIDFPATTEFLISSLRASGFSVVEQSVLLAGHTLIICVK